MGARILVGVLAIAAALGSRPGLAQTDEFYQGLEKRGLKTLMEAYLKEQGKAIEQEPGKVEGLPGQREMALAALAVKQALQAENMAARDEAFRRAYQFYEAAIAARKKAVEAVPPDKLKEQNEALFHLIKARLALANMIFQQWLTNDLNLLEVTQRYGGNRQHATELLRLATKAYAATIADCETWLTNLELLPGDDYSRFTNLGKKREVTDASKQANYFSAWAQYYYAWLLPEDYKPPKGGRSRKEILEDAITAFLQFADLDRDTNPNKWYARLGIGMAYRELGQFQKALQQLDMVQPPPVNPKSRRNQAWKTDVRIRVAYEKALTYLRMGKFQEACKTLAEARKAFGQALDRNLYGMAFPIVEASAHILEGKQKNQPALTEKGVAILKDLYKRDNPWPMVVSWVMRGLVGEEDTGVLPPFMLWVRATDLLEEAGNTQDPAQKRAKLEKAALFFKQYAEKAGPKDTNYPAALYMQAAALLQLGRNAEAAKLFRQVADGFPDYKYAKASATYAVGVLGQMYERAKTEENRQAYEEALRWFVQNHLDADPDQQYYYALVLYRGEKYLEAADAFGRVPPKAEHYPESRYWVALCRLEHFRNTVLASRDKGLILTGARDVAKRLLDYADYAFQIQNDPNLPKEKKAQLLQWAQFAYINAADVYLYNEVSLPADALPILEETEKRFTLSKDARGRVLKLKIDAYQKLGRLDDAQRVLDDFLKVAQPQDVGPVLRGLFAAMIDDVRALIKRGQKKLAATKVEQAKVLGERFRAWLEASNLPDKQVEIENTRYDLAELHLAIGAYDQAIQIYQELVGPKPEQVKPGEPLPEEAIYGMARAYVGLGDTAPNPEAAKPHYERALELWRVLRDVAGLQPKDRWEREYFLYYCKFKLGQKDEVAKALKALRIMSSEPLGGSDPVLQRKFRELEAAVAG